jgi:transcriptional regulator with XRE-family HTH domain
MAKNLSFYLSKSGRTQKEVAEVAGVAASTFSDWIKGKKYPRIDKIEILADYFGIMKSDLIEEKGEEHRGMKKNNDIISDIVVRLNTNKDFLSVVSRMNTDKDFLSVVEIVNGLDSAKLEGVKQMLCAFAE